MLRVQQRYLLVKSCTDNGYSDANVNVHCYDYFEGMICLFRHICTYKISDESLSCIPIRVSNLDIENQARNNGGRGSLMTITDCAS